MPRPDTQNARLIAAMRRAWVTPLDAFKIARTLRFSGRIMEIRAAGQVTRVLRY